MSSITELLYDLVGKLSALIESPLKQSEMNEKITQIAERVIAAARPDMPDWTTRVNGFGEFVAMKLFIDWNAFEAIPPSGTISDEELSKKLNADKSLVREEELAHTEISKRYLPGLPDTVVFSFWYEGTIVPSVKMPEHFAKYGRREPDSEIRTPLAFGFGQPEMTPYEVYYQEPKRRDQFQKAMQMAQYAAPFTGSYNFSWIKEKIRNMNEQRAVLVDVGAGNGHVTKAILQENSFIPTERVVLEDREDVLKHVAAMNDPWLKDAKLQIHDLHTRQPIKRQYFIILSKLTETLTHGFSQTLWFIGYAMASDSRLLIADNVIPNPPPISECMLDFTMLNTAGKERTATAFNDVITRAGLRMVKVHGMDKKLQVVECVKA
ncbi:O-methyltransferase [Colletotrichum costaricense]|uniref:O-methyltransferase n=1 Tax=Colletotrichum costaricense TaxID=1209916 RepID=A0AAJ0DXX0_9PEZI|nr:O-methyltransferase [Colletotrichum costaricense]KAK1520383.1 O-methyltransferase [Colletotrichum costaricense]